MNGKRILFAGIMTALIGFVIGLGVAKVGHPDEVRLRYETESARRLFRRYGLLGGGIGFVVGAGQEYLRQAKIQRDQDEKSRNK
ncbi:hypothetical protein cce_0194 [Crocosphaera subtropica ATCC 51142]|uniref:Uncharacterized protein n=1 Tax=Crocosphaera subtropica (strain ATCC 51142 / BH68) TaxID=43989 RepID=B1X045_CROS5|nr:hypothetical protein [Crocosphaera subtropica]ACB49546.1 hypothetical protein cce_0194 [Crocosphaera subtropica ATCC 51142]